MEWVNRENIYVKKREPMSPTLLADIILYIHALFIAFVVLAVPLIVLGAWRKWEWARRPAFRIAHLVAIAFVVINTWLGEMCPLTIWENDLREQAGTQGYGDSFIAYWLGKLLFYDFPAWVFTIAYSAFGLLIAALLWIAPIRWKQT